MRRLIYWIQSAYNAGITKHPMQVVEDMGMTIVRAEAFTIQQAWVFEVENAPDPLPNYIEPAPEKFEFT